MSCRCNSIGDVCVTEFNGSADYLPTGPTMGNIVPTFRVPASVRELKSRLRPSFDTANGAVDACATFPAEDRKAWKGFFQSWSEFLMADESWWDAASEYENGLVFEATLAEWQEKIAARCNLPGPRVKTDADTSSGQSLSAVKWASAAVLAVAVVWGVRTIIK